MWGAFLSEPLRIVGLVGRYPANCLMRRMPIFVRLAPFFPRGCPREIYAGLARLSAGCPPDKGRLHTCYSPVRRSPAGGASSSPAAARLACVKPAASVHPEPGSNSPLLVIYSLYISAMLCSSGLQVQESPESPSRFPLFVLPLSQFQRITDCSVFPLLVLWQ